VTTPALPLLTHSGQGTYTIVRSLITDLKAVKNATELEGFEQRHIRNRAALARYFAWLEKQLNNGVVLNESQGADQLEKFGSCVLPLLCVDTRFMISSILFKELSRENRTKLCSLRPRSPLRNTNSRVNGPPSCNSPFSQSLPFSLSSTRHLPHPGPHLQTWLTYRHRSHSRPPPLAYAPDIVSQFVAPQLSVPLAGTGRSMCNSSISSYLCLSSPASSAAGWV
jgi:hypothetical protein